MKIVEYQTQLPIKMDEFLISQLYMAAKASRQNSGGGDGIELIKNEPFEKDGMKGQYTFKRMHVASRVPKFLRAILPADALIIEEECYNSFPYIKTTYTNVWLKERFKLVIESNHAEGTGPETSLPNAIHLPDDELKIRKVDVIDLGVPVKQKSKEYKCNEDPTTFKSAKTGRGPLKPEWWKTADADGLPVTTAYKAVKCHFKWWGLQTMVEKYACSLCRDIFRNAQVQQFCWIDEWAGMSIEDIRKFEAEQNELAKEAITSAPLVTGDDEDGAPTEEGKEEKGAEEKGEEQKPTSSE